MNTFEQFANRGLLGLMVNSKGCNRRRESIHGDWWKEAVNDIQGCQKPLQCFSSLKQTTKDLLAFNKLKNTAKSYKKG
jgi:hypothetical protein